MSELLIKIAKARFENPESQIVHLVDDDEANKLLVDIKKYPHAYVLACLMDRQIKAERAWIIPYEIYKQFGSFEMKDLLKIKLAKFKQVFNKQKLHRFNDTMADIFYNGLQDIKNKYNSNASKIWSGKPVLLQMKMDKSFENVNLLWIFLKGICYGKAKKTI